jgi:hypothetical protein
LFSELGVTVVDPDNGPGETTPPTCEGGGDMTAGVLIEAFYSRVINLLMLKTEGTGRRSQDSDARVCVCAWGHPKTRITMYINVSTD